MPDTARGRGLVGSGDNRLERLLGGLEEVATAKCSNLDLRLRTAGGGVDSIDESLAESIGYYYSSVRKNANAWPS